MSRKRDLEPGAPGPSTFSRRAFLQGSVATGAALMTPGLLAAPSGNTAPGRAPTLPLPHGAPATSHGSIARAGTDPTSSAPAGTSSGVSMPSAEAGASNGSSGVAYTDRPNLLIVMVDEERNWFWYPEAFAFEEHLPRRAWLRSQGLRFDNYYVHTNPCTPSRSAIFTGRHTPDTGMFENTNVRFQRSMSPDIPTLGHMLATPSLGYYCAYIGKWHLAKEKDLSSARKGPGTLKPFGFQNWGGHDIEGVAGNEGLEHDPHIAEEAVSWLRSHRSDTRPWCLTVSFVNPHDIAAFPEMRIQTPDYGVKLPKNHWDDLTQKPQAHRYWQRFYNWFKGDIPLDADDTWRALLNHYIYYQIQVDAQIGRVLDAMDEELLRRTFIVFTSDHGDLGGAHMLRTKGPTVYRESQNVPFILIDPRMSAEKRGVTTDVLGGSIDLIPTLITRAGGSPQSFNLPGRSLLPALEHASPATAPVHLVRDAVLFTYDAWQGSPLPFQKGHLRGIYDGTYKYARYYAKNRENAPLDRQELELYDIAGKNADGHDELKNRAHDPAYAKTAAELNDRLAALIDLEVGRPMPTVASLSSDPSRL